MTEHFGPEGLNGLVQERLNGLNSSRIHTPTLSYTCVGRNPYCTTCQHHMTEDIARGIQVNGHMSAVRRFFCLFVTFDVLFTSLLWLICLVLAGDFNFTTAFYTEIVHYSIRTSLFDVVMASFSRFVILLLFYGLIQTDHWIIVATTTVGTCCFSVEKVYIFDWSHSQQVLAVMLIISSFILSWAEVWLLDIKVIPQERSAIQFLSGVTNADERSPLIRTFIHNHAQFDVMSDSFAGTFYSPVDTPQGSDDEDDRPDRRKDVVDISNYVSGGKSRLLLEEAWDILNNDKWVLESSTPQGDQIYTQKLPKGEKVFKLLGVVDAPLNLLIEVLYKRLEDFPIWNPTVKESKVLQKVNLYSDIIYQMSAEAGKGLVSSRDFVMLRHLAEKEGFHVISSSSIRDCYYPCKKNIVRGESGPGCWAFKSVAAFETEVRWLLNTNIRGWLPQYAVDSALTTVMADNMINLRKHLVALRQNTAA